MSSASCLTMLVPDLFETDLLHGFHALGSGTSLYLHNMEYF